MFRKIIFLAIFILTEQELTRKNVSGESTNNSNSSKSQFSKIQIFISIFGIIAFLLLFFICLSKILLRICQKCSAFEKLTESYEKNELFKDDNTLNQVKFVYGLKYIFLFLYQKIFKSSSFRADKIKYLGNCTICLNDFNEKEKIYITSCEHVYHKKCMRNYLDLIKKELEKKEEDIENFSSYFTCPNCKRCLFENKNTAIAYININKNCKEKNNIENNIDNNVNILVNNINKNVDFNNKNNINDEINDVEEIRAENYVPINAVKISSTKSLIDNTSSSSLRQVKFTNRKLSPKSLKRKRGTKRRQNLNNIGSINNKGTENFSTKNLQEGDYSSQQSSIKLKNHNEMKNKKESLKIIRNNNNNLIQYAANVSPDSKKSLVSSLDIRIERKIKDDKSKII